MKQDIKERQGFPSPTALTFSYEQFEGTIARPSATSGPKEILLFEESPHDTYEWEFAGIVRAAEATRFGGELGLISVVTKNYGVINNNALNTVAAFGQLAKFLGNFLDSNHESEKPMTLPFLTMGPLRPCGPTKPTGSIDTFLVFLISSNSLRS